MKRSESVERRGIRGCTRIVPGGLTRGTDAVRDVPVMTALHLRRLARIATSTAAGMDSEIRELVWDVRDAAVTGLRSKPEDVALLRNTGHVGLR